MIGIIVVLVLLIGYLFYKNKQLGRYLQQVLDLMRNQYNFHPELYQIMANNSGAIAIDIAKKMICVVDHSNVPLYLNDSNIHGVEILIEEEIQRGKNKLKELTKYYLYKSVLGETRANLSVQMAKIKEFKKIKNLKIKISTTDLNQPNIYLTFLENGSLKDKDKIIANVYDWVTRIETIQNNN